VNPLLLKTTQDSPAASWQDRLYALTSKPAASTHAPMKPSVVYEASTPAPDPTYGGAATATVNPSSDDALAALMARNSASSQPAGLFAGLGQALLGRFATDGANFVSDAPGTGSADASISLGIRTASGATVKLSLSGTQSGLSVSLTSDRTLTDSEKQAVAGLARAFQDAVDGLGKQPPTLSLDGLMSADPSVLTSVDLNASIATAPGVHESIALHTGSDSRSLKVDGAGGSIALGLDMSNPATWGNRAQRDASVASYLDQIDAAARRGHADASLVSLFKDGFSQLNSNYPPSPTAASTRGTVRDLSGNDHAMLTGLADFDMSISQASRASNPRQGAELDTFNYDASQSTTLSGRNASDRRITQSQASHLTASFHTSPWPDTPLNLTDKIGSQNYNYTKIDDSAHASTNIAYAKGKLIAASVSHDASQDTHVLKYMVGQLIDDSDTPSHQKSTRDLLPLLAGDARHPGSAADQANSANALHAYSKLLMDPSDVTSHA
jgi:hypothetical protein